MYAITDTGFRAITSASQAVAGETVVESLPESLLNSVRGEQRRVERNARLRLSDWTQVTDAPLTTMQQSAWAAYRHALRNLPEDPAWPDCDWPAEPSLPVGAASI